MLNLAGFEQLALLAKFILAAPHEFPRVLWRWMHQSNVKTLVWCLPYFFVSNAKSEQNSAELPACPSIQSLAVVKAEKQKTLLLVVPKLRLFSSHLRKCLFAIFCIRGRIPWSASRTARCEVTQSQAWGACEGAQRVDAFDSFWISTKS